MNFSDSIRTVFNKYAAFNGRASRSEYWYFVLFYYIVMFILFVPMMAPHCDSTIKGLFFVLFALFVLGTLVPSLAVSVRRLHDVDKSGWWSLLSLFWPIGTIVVFIFSLLPGAFRTNRYGVSPIPLPIADA